MRLLLIDYNIEHLDRLQSVCSGHELTAIPADRLTETDTAGYDALVLAGSYRHSAEWEPDNHRAELELIRSANRPLLGICLGFELVCSAYGGRPGELAGMSAKAAGASVVTPTADGARIFQGTDPIRVGETYRWIVDEVPRDLVVLARSDSGVEAVRHKTSPTYGLQLFPEDFTYTSDGKLVFCNILELFRKYVNRPV